MISWIPIFCKHFINYDCIREGCIRTSQDMTSRNRRCELTSPPPKSGMIGETHEEGATCFQSTALKIDDWNLNITQLKREMIWTKPPFVGSKCSCVQGVIHRYTCFFCRFCVAVSKAKRPPTWSHQGIASNRQISTKFVNKNQKPAPSGFFTWIPKNYDLEQNLSM